MFKGQVKKDYQKKYMKEYMRKKRGLNNAFKVGLNKSKLDPLGGSKGDTLKRPINFKIFPKCLSKEYQAR